MGKWPKGKTKIVIYTGKKINGSMSWNVLRQKRFGFILNILLYDLISTYVMFVMQRLLLHSKVFMIWVFHYLWFWFSFSLIFIIYFYVKLTPLTYKLCLQMALYIFIILTGVPLGVVKFDDPKLWPYDEDAWPMFQLRVT